MAAYDKRAPSSRLSTNGHHKHVTGPFMLNIRPEGARIFLRRVKLASKLRCLCSRNDRLLPQAFAELNSVAANANHGVVRHPPVLKSEDSREELRKCLQSIGLLGCRTV